MIQETPMVRIFITPLKIALAQPKTNKSLSLDIHGQKEGVASITYQN